MVVHDGSLPVRYYMFLFPEAEEQGEVGEPLLLTPLIRQGRTKEARWASPSTRP